MEHAAEAAPTATTAATPAATTPASSGWALACWSRGSSQSQRRAGRHSTRCQAATVDTRAWHCAITGTPRFQRLHSSSMAQCGHHAATASTQEAGKSATNQQRCHVGNITPEYDPLQTAAKSNHNSTQAVRYNEGFLAAVILQKHTPREASYRAHKVDSLGREGGEMTSHHRDAPAAVRVAGISASVFNLAKTLTGGGVLSLPFAVHEVLPKRSPHNYQDLHK